MTTRGKQEQVVMLISPELLKRIEAKKKALNRTRAYVMRAALAAGISAVK